MSRRPAPESLRAAPALHHEARTAARPARNRSLALAAVLFLAYAATLGLDAFDESDYAGDEPHYLLAAQSLVADGDLSVLDQYREAAYASFYPHDLDMHGDPAGAVLHEPHGAGFPALVAPAFALGGALAVELFLAAVAAAGGVAAYRLALRAVPDPWALGAAAAVGLSPPLLAYGTAVYPELAAGAALAGAALLALRLGERAAPRRLEALACSGLLAALPWLGLKYVPAGLVIGALAVSALRRRGRRLLAAVGVQLVGASAVAFVLVNQALYGGPTPYAADFAGESPTDAGSPTAYLERSYRLAALLVDRDYGLLRWAPVLVLALVGAWLTRSATQGEARRAATLCAAATGAQLLVAAFVAPTMFGFWFPGRHLVAALPLAVPLVALGMRRFPRTGVALATVGVATSVWVYLLVRLDSASLAVGWPDVPWGPLDAVLPFYGEAPLPYVLTAAAALAAVAVLGVRRLLPPAAA